MATNPYPHGYPSWLASDKRQAQRLSVQWLATVTAQKFGTAEAMVLDITNLGCRMFMSEAPTVGSFMSVNIPDFAEIPGWVAWSKSGQFGIDFSHPLPHAVLGEIIRRQAAAIR